MATNNRSQLNSPQPISVFISYSHNPIDQSLKDQLVQHLKPLKRQDVITTWHDQDIPPGSDWSEEININLDNADIVLLLISVNFIG